MGYILFSRKVDVLCTELKNQIQDSSYLKGSHFLKILLQSRKTLFSVPGGDTIQLLKTKEYLEELGVECDLSLELEPNLINYDVVHLFNITRPQELYIQAYNARRQGKKTLISPIYVDYSEYERQARSPWLLRMLANMLSPFQYEYLKILGRSIINREIHKGTKIVLKQGYKSLVNEILKMCDGLVPNSESEFKRLKIQFDCRDIPYWVVPNAIDQKLFNINRINHNKWGEYKDCVLCVARIEGLKNQLNVVRAMKKLPYKIVLVGAVAPNHRNYAQKVRSESGSNVYFLGQLPQEDIVCLYSVAKVHVLASWMETTGLSSLEAGVMNLNLVITDKGDTRDYFKDYALYCEPDSVESIRQAIDAAWKSPVNPKQRELILENFTWDIAARKTLEAYTVILDQSK